jgi:hypothetical protein
MGGHSAWKKRVKNGGLAKGSGGAIARHRPRWGRKGEDRKLNRKGNIAGGNPKKKKTKRVAQLKGNPLSNDSVKRLKFIIQIITSIVGLGTILTRIILAIKHVKKLFD